MLLTRKQLKTYLKYIIKESENLGEFDTKPYSEETADIVSIIIDLYSRDLNNNVVRIEAMAEKSTQMSTFKNLASKIPNGINNLSGGILSFAPIKMPSNNSLLLALEDSYRLNYSQTKTIPTNDPFISAIRASNIPNKISLIYSFFTPMTIPNFFAGVKKESSELLEVFITYLFAYFGVSSFHKDGSGEDVLVGEDIIIEAKLSSSSSKYNEAINKTPPGIKEKKLFCFARPSGSGEIKLSFVDSFLYGLFYMAGDSAQSFKNSSPGDITALANNKMLGTILKAKQNAELDTEDLDYLSQVFQTSVASVQSQAREVMINAFSKIFNPLLGSPDPNTKGKWTHDANQKPYAQKVFSDKRANLAQTRFLNSQQDIVVNVGNFLVRFRPEFMGSGGYGGEGKVYDDPVELESKESMLGSYRGIDKDRLLDDIKVLASYQSFQDSQGLPDVAKIKQHLTSQGGYKPGTTFNNIFDQLVASYDLLSENKELYKKILLEILKYSK